MVVDDMGEFHVSTCVVENGCQPIVMVRKVFVLLAIRNIGTIENQTKIERSYAHPGKTTRKTVKSGC